jgi:hypothetical protein
MWWRINSPFLPDSDYSDYLIQQYQDIKVVCNVTMPDSLIRALPNYSAAPTPVILPPGTDPNENGTFSGPCNGQVIASSSAKRDVLRGRDSNDRPRLGNDYSGSARVKRAASGACDSLSTTYGVPTGSLQVATGTLVNCFLFYKRYPGTARTFKIFLHGSRSLKITLVLEHLPRYIEKLWLSVTHSAGMTAPSPLLLSAHRSRARLLRSAQVRHGKTPRSIFLCFKTGRTDLHKVPRSQAHCQLGR